MQTTSTKAKAGRWSPRSLWRRRSRARLGWFLFYFVFVWVLSLVALEYGSYRFCDPEFHAKLWRLEALIEQNPQHPLWLMLGTSKLNDGCRPDLIARAGDTPIVFNFGRPAARVLWQYLALRRLLDEGIRPEWLGIEIMGPTLSGHVELSWADWPTARALRYRELAVYRPFSTNYGELRWMWWRSRLSLNLLSRQLDDAFRVSHREEYDPFGWRLTSRVRVGPATHAERVEIRRKEYLKFWEDFGIGADADRCLRALLDLCRARGIKTFIYEMPEAEQFRAFYPAGARGTIEAYLDHIATEYRIPWVNAQNWVDDSNYTDGLHLNQRGAEQFSRRFRDEVFQPFVRQWPVQVLARTEERR